MGNTREEKDHNKKYENYKRKNIDKDKYTVNVVDQPLIKLVGKLKDKSIKTIYIQNN